ncbi:MAG: energy transducer TonB [candidate division WOR-3 bacterium]
MTKEFFFSLFGHLAICFFFAVFGATTKKAKTRPYPLVYRVSLVSGFEAEEAPKPAIAVVNKTPAKPEPVKKPTEKPKTQSQSSGIVKTKAGLGARAEGFEYSYYLQIVLSRIGENWINPYASSNYQFKCTIFFIIERDGTITQAKIETSSKNSIYDQSALRAVLATRNLPPLPQEYQSNQLKIHLEFEYQP